MKNRVNQNIPIGLLAYSNSEPIAWCSIAPRNTYKPLGGDKTKEGVGRLLVFLLSDHSEKKVYHRNSRMPPFLMPKIMAHNTSKHILLQSTPQAIGTWVLSPIFEKVGFQFIKSVGTRRNVMILPLT